NVYNEAMGELGLFGLGVLVTYAWAFVGNWRESTRLVKACDAGGEPPDPDLLFLHRVSVAAMLTCLMLFLLGWAGHNLGRYNWLWSGAFSGIALNHLRGHVVAWPSVVGDDAR